MTSPYTPSGPAPAAPARAGRNWMQLEATALALLVLVACVAVGVRARGRAVTARAEAERLRGVASSIQQFQATFHAVTPEERRRWGAEADSSVLGIAPEERVGLTEQIARLAEQSGLDHPRVNFGAADSSVTTRDLGVADAQPGDYTITVQAGGGFAELLTFVNALPVAVSVAHLDAARDPLGGTTRFRVVLAVYENKNASRS